ncbi:Trm112 family protein [Ehrlichia sp. JZT12]
MFDHTLLDILVCPLTKDKLQYKEDTHELISEKAKLAFPIHEGIPIMLVDQARKLEES